MHPDMDSRDRQKCFKAGDQALPPDHQTTIFLLKPGKGPLGLEPWHHLFDRSATSFLRLPNTFRDLGPNAPFPELLP